MAENQLFTLSKPLKWTLSALFLLFQQTLSIHSMERCEPECVNIRGTKISYFIVL